MRSVLVLTTVFGKATHACARPDGEAGLMWDRGVEQTGLALCEGVNGRPCEAPDYRDPLGTCSHHGGALGCFQGIAVCADEELSPSGGRCRIDPRTLQGTCTWHGGVHGWLGGVALCAGGDMSQGRQLCEMAYR